MLYYIIAINIIYIVIIIINDWRNEKMKKEKEIHELRADLDRFIERNEGNLSDPEVIKKSLETERAIAKFAKIQKSDD